MESLIKTIRINAIKCGLLLGLVLVVLNIISFYFITSNASTPVLYIAAPIFFTIILPIITVVLICFYIRKAIGGYWNLREATTGIFIMFVIAYAVQTLGRDVLFAKVIEPGMTQKTEAAFLKASEAIKKQPGANSEQVDKNIAEIKKGFEDQKNVTIGRTIQAIAISVILIFVLALIFAALFKREPPYYTTVVE